MENWSNTRSRHSKIIVDFRLPIADSLVFGLRSCPFELTTKLKPKIQGQRPKSAIANRKSSILNTGHQLVPNRVVRQLGVRG